MFDEGLFGGMFDFNGDGKLDSFEKAAEFGFFMQMMDDIEKSWQESTGSTSGGYGYSGFGGTTELEDVLDDAGIDVFDFELMSDDERAEALSDAGYDIDDFDF